VIPLDNPSLMAPLIQIAPYLAGLVVLAVVLTVGLAIVAVITWLPLFRLMLDVLTIFERDSEPQTSQERWQVE
jgi:hypothetical protein